MRAWADPRPSGHAVTCHPTEPSSSSVATTSSSVVVGSRTGSPNTTSDTSTGAPAWSAPAARISSTSIVPAMVRSPPMRWSS
jgi:hypothetical protein